VQANFYIDDAIDFNVGLRYVKTNQTSSGNTVANIFAPTELITPISEKSHYSELLPSANLKYELEDDLILRAAYSRTLTRANLPDLAPSESVRGISDVDGGTGSKGNPQLLPFIADNIDLGIEWYFEEEGILSATIFYKDIDGLIDTKTFVDERQFPRQADGVIVTGDILFTQPENGISAAIEGFEFGFQKALPANFGLLFNYTFASSSADFGSADDVRSSGLPGLSRNSYNASVYYDDGKLDARISYAWRERYLAQFSDDFGVPRFVDDFGQLDLSANYSVNEHLQIQMQVLNVTNEQRINQATSQYLPYGVSELDRRVLFGARYSF
jgi:iron complex outermembrane receptor protein